MSYEEFPNAYKWQRPLDPSNIAPYVCHFRHATKPMLDPLEKITSFTVTLSENALLQGLQLGDGSYAPTTYMNGSGVKIWLKVDPTKQGNVLFNCDGLWLPVTFKVVTDANPANTYEATCAVRVVQN